MRTKPTKKDTVVWISDGVLTMSGDITEQREGMLAVAEHHLLGFGDCMSMFESHGFLQNEAEVKQKFQDFYDTFMKEFDYYAESTGTGLHDCPLYQITPKPDALKYSENKPEEDAPEQGFNLSPKEKEEVAV